MKKLFKKLALATVLLTVVACANTNDGRYVQASDYQPNYDYTASADLYGSDWH